jgi:hypothetical protein
MRPIRLTLVALAITVQADSGPQRHKPEQGRMRIEMGELRALKVAPGFRYVGGHRFLLTPTVDAEQHLFVVADSARNVQRMLWVQVESRLPADSGVYQYASDSLRTVAGLSIRVGVRAYTTPPEPTSDRGSAYGIVTAAGYRIPVNATRVRMVYLPEQPARREVMLIYVEPDGAASTPAAGFDQRLKRALRAVQLETTRR